MSIVAGTRQHRRLFAKCRVAMVLCLTGAAGSAFAAAANGASTNFPPPTTPREFFNTGTRELAAGKLREAEASLETALASQNERLQTPTLYNLGEVRFAQGAEELKKKPSAESVTARSRKAGEEGDEAIRAA